MTGNNEYNSQGCHQNPYYNVFNEELGTRRNQNWIWERHVARNCDSRGSKYVAQWSYRYHKTSWLTPKQMAVLQPLQIGVFLSIKYQSSALFHRIFHIVLFICYLKNFSLVLKRCKAFHNQLFSPIIYMKITLKYWITLSV